MTVNLGGLGVVGAIFQVIPIQIEAYFISLRMDSINRNGR